MSCKIRQFLGGNHAGFLQVFDGVFFTFSVRNLRENGIEKEGQTGQTPSLFNSHT